MPYAKGFDNGFGTRIVQIDFSAAFDLVNHKALVFNYEALVLEDGFLDF